MNTIYPIKLNNATVHVELGDEPANLTFTFASGKTVNLQYPGRAAHAAGLASKIDYGSLTSTHVSRGGGKFDVTVTDGAGGTMTYEATNAAGTEHR